MLAFMAVAVILPNLQARKSYVVKERILSGEI
jgi:hypothetical protein